MKSKQWLKHSILPINNKIAIILISISTKNEQNFLNFQWWKNGIIIFCKVPGLRIPLCKTNKSEIFSQNWLEYWNIAHYFSWFIAAGGWCNTILDKFHVIFLVMMVSDNVPTTSEVIPLIGNCTAKIKLLNISTINFSINFFT